MARKSLPTVVGNIPNDLRIWIDRVREILDSNGNDRLVSVSELASGSVKIPGSSISGDITGGSGSSNNFQTPPAPTNVVTSGAMDNIVVTWDAPNYTGHAYAEIWAAADNAIGHAVKVGMVPGAIFVHNLGQAATRYYWVRFVNQDFETGDFNATAGTEGETGTNPNYVLGLIANATDLNPVQVKANAFQVVDPNATQGTISPFTVITTPTTINGVAVNPGVYMNALYVMDGSITNAKIGNLAVDNAKIANLSADKVTFGQMSGDRISVKSLNADRINVTQLSGIAADLGTVTAGLFKTSAVTSGWRTEIDSAGSFPFWYGTGNKIASNAKFYMDVNGNITIQGGNFTVKDTSGNVVMSSGGAVWDYVNGKPTSLAGINATESAKLSSIATGATKNTIYRQATAPTGSISTDDIWIDTSTLNPKIYSYNGTSWVLAGDVTANNTAAAIAGQGAFATLNQVIASNASTYIANAAIGSAQIGSIALVGTSNFSVNSLVNGTGTIQDNRGVRIYSNGVRRVMLGDLSVPNGQ